MFALLSGAGMPAHRDVLLCSDQAVCPRPALSRCVIKAHPEQVKLWPVVNDHVRQCLAPGRLHRYRRVQLL